MTIVKKMMAVSSLALSALFLLIGCKDTIEEDGGNETEVRDNLEPVRMSDTNLKIVSSTSLEQLLKNGIRLTAKSRLENPPSLEVFTDSSEGTPINWLTELPEGHAVGQRAIFNPPYWYVSSTSGNYDGNIVIEDSPPGFQILRVDSEQPEFELVNTVELDPGLGKLDALFQLQNAGDRRYVATLRNFVTDRYLSSDIFKDGSVWVNDAKIEPTYLDIFYHKAPSGTIEITLSDVTDPESVQLKNTLKIDGKLVGARQIGGSLYLVTAYQAWIDNLYFILGPNEREINESLVAKTSLNSLLPNYSVDNTKKVLFDKCFVPEGVKENSAHVGMLTLIKVDLATTTINSTLCFAGPSIGTSTFADEAFYFSGPIYDTEKRKSAIYKVDLTQEGPQLIASGVIDGSTSLSGLADTQMSEWDKELRVLSSDITHSRYHFYLTHLVQKGGQLEVVSQSQSAEWGLDHDEFQYDIDQLFFVKDQLLIGSRKLNDKTYYKSLNDSDSAQFTELLGAEYVIERVQTIGEDLLLVLGASGDGGAWVGVFHTRDDSPMLIDSISLGADGTSSYVRRPDEVSFFRADDHLRIAFPINLVSTEGFSSVWEYAGLQFLEINGLPSLAAPSGAPHDYSNITIQDAGALKTESEPYDRYFSNHFTDNLSLLNADSAYLYRHSAFWSAAWLFPDGVIGPVTKELNGCGDLNPSVLVTINLPEASEANACDTLVTVDTAVHSYTLEPTDIQSKSCVFSGPPNEAGQLKITGKLEGYKQVGKYVNVQRDRCTSFTEAVSFDLTEQPIF